MTKQYLSIPVQYNTSTQLQADDIKIPVEILVMHDKLNLNNSNFEFEVIDADVTKESIKNIPILGYIKKVDGSDSKDFAGHEIEVVFKDGEIKIVYLERPIGVVPETNNYEYVEKDGKKYVKVIGYLWKDYMNDGYEILQENPSKSVSMEIVVDAYEVRKDSIVDIKAYRYTGITVLGDNVNPGMEGANMQVIGQFSDNQKFSKEFYERVEKLNFELNSNNNTSLEGGETQEMSKKKEGNQIVDEKLELLKKYNLTTENISFSIEDLSLEEIESKIKEHFALLSSQKEKEIINALRDEEFTDRWGDEYRKYSYVDYNETEVFAYDRQDNWNLYGFTYSMNGDKVIIDFASKKRKKFEIVDFVEGETMFSLFPQEAIDYAIKDTIKETEDKFTSINTELQQFKSQISDYENKLSDFDTIKTEFESLKTEFETLTTENNQLKEFKQNIEFKIEIENKRVEMEGLIEEFESVLSGNEEFEQIKNDITDDEKLNTMEYNTVETQLYAIVGKVKFEKKKKDKIKKNVAFSRVNVEIDNGGLEVKNEYGEASKYLPKK